MPHSAIDLESLIAQLRETAARSRTLASQSEAIVRKTESLLLRVRHQRESGMPDLKVREIGVATRASP